MKKLLLSTIVAAPLACLGGAAFADCGELTIASMNWQSAEVLANLDQFILNNGYDCSAEITTSDTVPAITSLVEKGTPEIVPEAWVGLVPEVFASGMAENKIVSVGNSLSEGGQQGWFIPKYMVDANPELATLKGVLEHPELFPAPEDSSKGAIYNGPEGWGGTIVTNQLAKAFDLEGKGFTVVSAGSAAALDAAIAKAYEAKEGVLAFYWAPTSLLGKYEMVRVDLGVPVDMDEWKRCTSVADCPDPKPNAIPPDEVLTLVAKPFADSADPAVLDYLSKRNWTNDTVSKLMAWMTDNQATGEDGAKEFLRNNEEMWMGWVSPEAAEKIKSAL
ncbi:glycine betaine ABC transporter substrate-binding protein [Paracoccus sulfuroxidans]|uniref:Glycine betaine/proline transport system substrate-binding protein n=1 Tax=Paracoccus sulfuroxidans TaxID=384678 RepID=A0A562NX50_9RHOB|nr:glycine betaine ABC transporter substrate-binding protein [Paracoccus sulfuroxidans]TWI36784.1 glycine betaine/proline transport system substrate-binding protein [Paracoccus sulfuroxidans]